MNDAAAKWIIVTVSVVMLSTLVSVIAWTYDIGSDIFYGYSDRITTVYSEAGLSMLIDSSNLDDLDAANIYKILELNRNVITDFSIKNIDSTFVTDTRELLNRPSDRFSIVITGDSAVGFIVEIKQVS